MQPETNHEDIGIEDLLKHYNEARQQFKTSKDVLLTAIGGLVGEHVFLTGYPRSIAAIPDSSESTDKPSSPYVKVGRLITSLANRKLYVLPDANVVAASGDTVTVQSVSPPREYEFLLKNIVAVSEAVILETRFTED